MTDTSPLLRIPSGETGHFNPVLMRSSTMPLTRRPSRRKTIDKESLLMSHHKTHQFSPTSRKSFLALIVELLLIILFICVLFLTVPVSTTANAVSGVSTYLHSIETMSTSNVYGMITNTNSDKNYVGTTLNSISNSTEAEDYLLRLAHDILKNRTSHHHYSLLSIPTIYHLKLNKQNEPTQVHSKKQQNEQNMESLLPIKFLSVHRLINSIVLTQKRSVPYNCSYASIQSLYGPCYLSDHLLSTPTWNIANISIPYSNEVHGYALSLPLNQGATLNMLKYLFQNDYFDMATREVIFDFTFHNSPGHFTGNCKVIIDFSEYGNVHSFFDLNFLRLRPYSSETHGNILLTCQVILLFLFIISFFFFLYELLDQPHIRWCVAHVFRIWSIVDLAICILLSLTLIYWGLYIFSEDRQNFIFQESSNSINGFMKNGTIQNFNQTFIDNIHSTVSVLVLAERFQNVAVFMSITLLLMVVRFIEFMLIIDHLAMITKVLGKAMENLGWFCVIFIAIFMGFAISAYFSFGQHVSEFSSLSMSLHNLALWFLAIGEGENKLFSFGVVGTFFLITFMFVLMILIFNMFITIILSSYDDVSDEKPTYKKTSVKPYNIRLAHYICDKLHIPPFEDEDDYFYGKKNGSDFSRFGIRGNVYRLYRSTLKDEEVDESP